MFAVIIKAITKRLGNLPLASRRYWKSSIFTKEKKRTELEKLDDWLYLLEVLPRIAEKAPREELRNNGSVKSWAAIG